MSSFQKKIKPKIISIPGTKPSIHNSQLLISTGIHSLDFILGGGLPVGSVLLIEEDAFDVYSKLFLKFYLAEGLKSGQFIYLASLNDIPDQMVNDLPGSRGTEHKYSISKPTDEKLEIAWRYQAQKLSESSSKMDDNNNTKYDITKPMEISHLTDFIYTWNASSFQLLGKDLKNSLLWSLLVDIENKIKDHDFLPSPSKLQSNVLRIAIHSLLSPLWSSEYQKAQKWSEVTLFFTMLKAIVRSSFSVAFVTVPSHLFTDSSLVSSLHGIVDFGLGLESFQGSEKETNPLYKDYHGLLHISKLPTLNTMIPNHVNFNDWAFHLSRKTISIRRLHLPPELSDTASRAPENAVTSCSGGSGHLDF